MTLAADWNIGPIVFRITVTVNYTRPSLALKRIGSSPIALESFLFVCQFVRLFS